MIEQAIKHKSHIELQEGDYAYVKLKAYCHASVERRVLQKLSPRFYGPFKVLRCIGTIAYHLELSAGVCVHPVFHVSLLKPHSRTLSDTLTNLHEKDKDDRFFLLPERVLEERTILKNGKEVNE